MTAAAAWLSRKPWTAFALAACVCASACKGCDKKGDVLATLDSSSGQVTRDLAVAPQDWKPALKGDAFRLGDGIKTSGGATARLTLSDGSALAVQEKAVLRFLATVPDAHNFNVEVGQVLIEAGPTPLRFGSSVGLAVLEPGGRLIVTQEGKKTRYEVIVGMANFIQDGAEPLKVSAGQRIQVDLETAQIERLEDVAKAPEPAAEAPQNAPAVQGDIAANVRGKRVRYKANEAAAWSSLDPGNHDVADGGTFDVPPSASVRVSRGDEAATVYGRGLFRVGGKRGLVEANVGRVSVDHAAGETIVTVPGGSIAVRNGDGAADIAVDKGKGTQLRVREGAAAVQTNSGSDEITAGETLSLDSQGHMRVDGRGPELADLLVQAGASFVVHDPSPPTAVQVKFPSNCLKGGRLRIGPSRFVLPRKTDASTAIANMQTGVHRYTVICPGNADATGTVQVIRDPGTADLPRLAPATLVDTDGRKYTILYQNLLPEVRLSWPKAPKASAYQVALTTGDKTKTFTTNKPRYVFKSASLPEGNHSLVFKALGEKETSSPETAVKIRFDNAAPAAMVKAPQNKRFKAGETVEVAGSALPGWVVTAAGAPLPLDPNLRFAGQVRSDAEQRSLAIRFEHKDRGVHYYLRRSAGRLP